MEVQSIRWAMPCGSDGGEVESTCSLITRVAAVGVGGIALLVGILALSGIPGLNSLGTLNEFLLTVAGGLILLAGLCLKSVQDNGRSAPQSVQNSDVESRKRAGHKPIVPPAKNQLVDLRPLFHRGESWIDDLVDETDNYIAFKLIVAAKTKNRTITEPLILLRTPDILTKDAMFIASEELKMHISHVFQKISLLESIEPAGIVSFTLLTKSDGNIFGVHHLCLQRGASKFNEITAMNSNKQEPQENKDFAAAFRAMELKVEPQLDASYNFI